MRLYILADSMNPSLPYLSFCNEQQRDLNAYTHIIKVLQFNGTIANTAWLNQKFWLVGWLFNGMSTQKGQFANCGREKPALSAKDDQRDTMHITLRYMITM